MQSMNGGGLVIALVNVGFVVRQQLRIRPVRRNVSLIVPVILGVLGAALIALGIASVVKEHSLTALPVVLLEVLASLAVAGLFGAVRARTVRWREPRGEVLRQGAVATTGLWVASVAVHTGLALWTDHAAGTGSLGAASLYAYLAIGLGTQNLLVRRRAVAL
ncbi:hypothetical protein ACIP4W_23995 [Streptomyces sp. NPDC088846]|uniref:hypothetical protein n=1 Tax=Streptomyces sp. NPDC088846 TaxID=3365908 RepID=UPI0038277779